MYGYFGVLLVFVFLCTSSKIAISFGIVVLNPQHWKTIISLFKPSKYILNVVERPSNSFLSQPP